MRLRGRSVGFVDPGLLIHGQPVPMHPARVGSPARSLLDYLKYEGLRTSREKWAAGAMLVCLIALVLATWGIPVAKIVPVWGRSLQPTAQVVTLPEPIAFLSFSGWVHTSDKEERFPGRIVYFQVPKSKDREVKRIFKERVVAGARQFWLLPDSDVTGEGSGFGRYDWVDESQILGVVDRIWTPARLWRSRTTRGKFENWVEIAATKLSPSKSVLWRWDKGAVAVLRGSRFAIYLANKDGTGKLAFEGTCSASHYEVPSWMGEAFAFPKGDFVYGYWQENSQLRSVVIKPLSPRRQKVIYDSGDLPNFKVGSGCLDWKSWLSLYGGKVIASQPAGLNALALFDGDPLSSYGPLPEDPKRIPAEVVIDLGIAPNITGVAVYGLSSGDQFRVEVLSSTDGAIWAKVLSQLSETDTPSLEMQVPASPARFWKLRVHALPWVMTGTIGELRLTIK